MNQYRIDFQRYLDGQSRRRTEHFQASNIEDALDKALLYVAAWSEIDHDSVYRVAAIASASSSFDDEASIGWETGSEWSARTKRAKG